MSLIRERLYICYTNNLNKFILRKKKLLLKKLRSFILETINVILSISRLFKSKGCRNFL